jgi:hypothetical protein
MAKEDKRCLDFYINLRVRRYGAMNSKFRVILTKTKIRITEIPKEIASCEIKEGLPNGKWNSIVKKEWEPPHGWIKEMEYTELLDWLHKNPEFEPCIDKVEKEILERGNEDQC